jgi:hypothetical protein
MIAAARKLRAFRDGAEMRRVLLRKPIRYVRRAGQGRTIQSEHRSKDQDAPHREILPLNKAFSTATVTPGALEGHLRAPVGP